MKSVLVTVGSTKFEDLVEVVDTVEFLESIQKLGYNKLTIQYGGTADKIPYVLKRHLEKNPSDTFTLNVFGLSLKFMQIMEDADLVISHAGAGTILEGLRNKKAMIVVINEKLMNNHQEELAEAMEKRGLIYSTTVSGLLTMLQTADLSKLKLDSVPPPQTKKFAEYLNSSLGV
eukprot:TRINITY_DN16290_c0_g1_i1.p1 TRINITY_DN16290_c0_g1~~TRINITY_DN16290_c0_g1_i1.p1  ORF type:complete len:174 (-),score=26.27 TRINITY_DN16290_c0_g1_i1:106-627(-)